MLEVTLAYTHNKPFESSKSNYEAVRENKFIIVGKMNSITTIVKVEKFREMPKRSKYYLISFEDGLKFRRWIHEVGYLVLIYT